jgi:ribosome-binding protein aMBF1 (putative translation factor)
VGTVVLVSGVLRTRPVDAPIVPGGVMVRTVVSDMIRFPEQLRKLREERGMMQSELADKMGFDASVISNYERGSRSPSIEKLIRLANILNVTIDRLVVMDVIEHC